ncbi:hypothetical protein [Roseitalea porphyridii]|uniref:hypothetical protein n=1 Tax=Roseitalea porphyridii TaxID=1852022 RepID=UPI0013155C99|nr:hypothetical protein [Roseitalea porphyridii]
MLHAGFDMKTTTECVSWSSPTVLLNTYAHAIADPTVADALVKAQSKEPGLAAGL